MRGRPRLSAPECKLGGLFNTSPRDRKSDNAKPRRPKIKVAEDGTVTISTRKNMPPRPKRHFPMLVSTMPTGKRWTVKKIWDGPERLGTRTGAYRKKHSNMLEAKRKPTGHRASEENVGRKKINKSHA